MRLSGWFIKFIYLVLTLSVWLFSNSLALSRFRSIAHTHSFCAPNITRENLQTEECFCNFVIKLICNIHFENEERERESDFECLYSMMCMQKRWTTTGNGMQYHCKRTRRLYAMKQRYCFVFECFMTAFTQLCACTGSAFAKTSFCISLYLRSMLFELKFFFSFCVKHLCIVCIYNNFV